MVNILLVEDNESLRALMALHLKRAGYGVHEASNGEEALKILDAVPVHLMVADVMMPVMDGYELTCELRRANFSLPVLIVTARESLEDKRAGFKAGADDYMVKPIDMEELLLRIEALLRRSSIAENHRMSIGRLTLEQDSLSVIVDGKSLLLPQKEFLLLQMLLSYPGKIFTRQMLMDEIWGYDSQTEPRTVDVHIKRLRDKFAGDPDFDIQTVRGLGYRAVLKR